MRWLNIDQVRRFVWMALVVMCVTLWPTGCETTRETTRTERETVTVENNVDDTPLTGSAVTDEKRTTKTTTEKGEGGILGGAFHLVGEILAFPFRVIAGILDFIF